MYATFVMPPGIKKVRHVSKLLPAPIGLGADFSSHLGKSPKKVTLCCVCPVLSTPSIWMPGSLLSVLILAGPRLVIFALT